MSSKKGLVIDFGIARLDDLLQEPIDLDGCRLARVGISCTQHLPNVGWIGGKFVEALSGGNLFLQL